MSDSKQSVVRTPLFPSYTEVRKLMAIWENTPVSAVKDMQSAIMEQTGTPQNPVDWSNPDEWIAERLQGKERELAQRIWQESKGTVNPRHTYGSYLFINTYQLLLRDAGNIYRLSEAGQRFLDEDPATVRHIDEAEGMPKLLSILAAHSPARRGDLLEEWGEYLLAHSNFGTPSMIKDTLRRRIQNLVERGYIAREGNTYTITDQGIAYAASAAAPAEQQPHQQVLTAIKRYNDAQEAELRARLAKMNPYKFEVMVKDLLEAMDYEDVVVTKQSGDKGVDVVATYQFGITQIKEVVQVKRHAGSITRPILDQLRGALPYHQAIRGTIITLGKFAQGCKDAALYPGAAPITLIDGDKLIELLLKHSVAVKKRTHTLIEIDDSYFADNNTDTGLEPDPEP